MTWGNHTFGGFKMLVLSRKLGEKIYIGDNISITVLDIDRGKIRLGIEAPRDVPIHRRELLPLSNQQQQQEPEPEPEPQVETKPPPLTEGDKPPLFDPIF